MAEPCKGQCQMDVVTDFYDSITELRLPEKRKTRRCMNACHLAHPHNGKCRCGYSDHQKGLQRFIVRTWYR